MSEPRKISNRFRSALVVVQNARDVAEEIEARTGVKKGMTTKALEAATGKS